MEFLRKIRFLSYSSFLPFFGISVPSRSMIEGKPIEDAYPGYVFLSDSEWDEFMDNMTNCEKPTEAAIQANLALDEWIETAARLRA